MLMWHVFGMLIQSRITMLLIPNATIIYASNSVLIYILTIDCIKIVKKKYFSAIIWSLKFPTQILYTFLVLSI
jgi:hypothetical protein